MRDHLEAAAAAGSPGAREALEGGPDCPEEMLTYVDWAFDLVGRCGAGMAGVSPLSHLEIEAWARLHGVGELHPLEVQALLTLDAAIRHPGEEGADEEKVHVERAWPTRRGDAAPQLLPG